MFQEGYLGILLYLFVAGGRLVGHFAESDDGVANDADEFFDVDELVDVEVEDQEHD